MDTNFTSPESAKAYDPSKSDHASNENKEIVDWNQPTDLRDLDYSYRHPDFIIPGC
jgi:hypothetical protein